MSHREQMTGTFCEECGRPEYLQIVTMDAWQGSIEVSRRGPSCWDASCSQHRDRNP